MFSRHKNTDEIAAEQHELLEYAQKRIRQKKRLYAHFVLFLIGSVFLVLTNKILKYGAEYNWFVWAITFWAFLFVLHCFNVFITQKFMGQAWERRQREKLVRKQRERLTQLQEEIASKSSEPVAVKKKEL